MIRVSYRNGTGIRAESPQPPFRQRGPRIGETANPPLQEAAALRQILQFDYRSCAVAVSAEVFASGHLRVLGGFLRAAGHEVFKRSLTRDPSPGLLDGRRPRFGKKLTPMTIEQTELLVELLRVLTAWPLVLLFLVMYFRRDLRVFMPLLARRLRKATVAGNTFEFQEAAVGAFADAVEKGAKHLEGRPQELVEFVREQARKLPLASETPRDLRSPLATVERALATKAILWVDDNPTHNLYEASLFERLGATIDFVQTTEAALKALANSHYDLIISDVERLEGDVRNPEAGYQLLDALEEAGRSIPTILYTGNVRRIDRKRARSAVGLADEPVALTDLVLDQLIDGPAPKPVHHPGRFIAH